jgi:hypothetical protein
VTAIPIPLQSTSGRFSSLNPPRQAACQPSIVTGSVVSTRLIQLGRFSCGGADSGIGRQAQRDGVDHPPLANVLMNVKLDDPADARHMVVGRRVTMEGTFRIAREYHGPYLVFFLIAEKARLAGGDPLDRSAAPANTSYMVCQPPELDGLASKLGSELCVQSTVVANLSEAGLALEAAARALKESAANSDVSSGDQNTIACRRDPERSDTHLSAIACARRSYWNWWDIKHRMGQDYTRPAPP